MLIDAHHHFWKYSKSEYAWISDEMQTIRRDFLPVDLESEIKRNGVKGVVTVQVRQNLQENDWMLQLADQHSFVKGVVGWVDLQSNEVESQLKKYAAHEKFVGIRNPQHPGVMLVSASSYLRKSSTSTDGASGGRIVLVRKDSPAESDLTIKPTYAWAMSQL